MQVIKSHILSILPLALSLLSSLFILTGYSQNKKIDSLILISNQMKSEKLIDSNYAQIQYDLAMCNNEIENFDNAILHSVEAIKYVTLNSDLHFSINNSLGSFYLGKADYLSSLECFKKALEIAIELNDPIKQGVVHFNLSTHYDHSANRKLSYSHLKKAYDLMIEAGDTSKTVHLLNSMAIFNTEDDNYEEAESKYQRALKLAISTQDPKLISTTYNNYGKLFLAIQDTVTALKYLKKSYDIDKVSGTQTENAVVTYNIAVIYRITNQPDSAIYYYNLSKYHSNNIQQLYYLQSINKSLFELYYQQEQYDTLPEIFAEYRLVSDSILSRENLKKYAEAQNEIELMTNEQELNLIQLTQKNDKQALILISLITVLLVIVLIGSMVARNNLHKQKIVSENLYKQTNEQKVKIENQKKELQIKHEALEKNAEEKDRIMSLLAHDLRTPFSSIHSLNHLITATGNLTDKQVEFLETSNKVVHGGLDLISDILDIYKLENIESFDIDEINISMLLNNSIEKLNPIVTVKNQNLISNYKNEILFNTNREMIQSAVDNLLSNATKYSEQGKEIELSAFKTDSELIIKIKDNGQGFKEDEKSIIFDRFNKFTRSTIRTEPSTGLGLFLVKSFVEKLNGTISVESKSGEGSTFTLIFKEIKN
jgi:signal transduction histidine kinase